MLPSKRWGVAALCVGLVLGGRTARADGWENVPTGSRTAAMGGAGIAGGSDSAMPIINPAGIALVPGSIASLSASLYQISRISVPNFIADGPQIPSQFGLLDVSQQGVESLEFGSFPSGIAYFLHLPGSVPMVFAGSLSIPRNINRRFILNTEFLGNGTAIKENITTIIQEQSYMAAFSWAASFGSLRIGASLLGSYTTFLRTNDRSQLETQGTLLFVRTQARDTQSVTSFDLGAIVGAQLDVTDGFQVGLGVRSPSLHLGGGFTGSTDFTSFDSMGEPLIVSVQANGDGVRGFPLRVGLGAQLKGNSWAWALDGTVHIPRTGEYKLVGTQVTSDIGEGGAPPDTERDFEVVLPTKTRFNVATGFEYQVTDTNWLRVGVFTELSALQSAGDSVAGLNAGAAPPPGLIFQFNIHRFGGSAGWGTKLGPIDTTIGVRTTFGTGDTVRQNPDNRFRRVIAEAQTTSATLVDALLFISAAIDVTEGASQLLDTVTGESTPSLETGVPQ